MCTEPSKEIVIASCENMVLSAIKDDTGILEMRVDEKNSSLPRLGDIYVGKVNTVKEALHAAFIDIAPGLTCYMDLKELPYVHFTAKYSKKPIASGDELLVEISREAIKSKAPSLTANLTFPGKNLILTCGRKQIGLSGRLDAAKKEAFKNLLSPLLTGSYGLIVRTNAGQTGEREVILEAERLAAEYDSLMRIADTRKCYSCVRRGSPEYISLLRDAQEADLKGILTDDDIILEELKDYAAAYMPSALQKISLYRDPLQTLCKKYALQEVLEDASRERVWLKSGAYLVIEPTEAMTVIDINTGKADTKRKKEQFLKINLEATKEIARQIRLRNLSGIILIDYINMESDEDRSRVTDYLQSLLKEDPVQTDYVDTTALQLVEITRKKVRKPLRDYVKKIKEIQSNANL